ncbi:hypothetical protein Cgig2_013020 [Carnegiea gigantea]|uniref:non-specific serine/threonine protein kinase n=1 Tax=Carnegiea gigantea TaxID=171969 RepID=A0A9Q1GQI8_9CARY|nr:hypothetical protein Cgig2_013020 [Carnegiea gigantea]
MSFHRLPLSLLLLLLLLLLALLPPSYSQVCQRFCGDIPLRYPFGGGPGCGDPRFTKYVSCNQRQLIFTTHTGSYVVTNIDYPNAIIYILDPTMSTCLCAQPSKGFSLDWDAPFSFDDSSVFALLDCSLDSSPIYKGAVGGNTSNVPQCANSGTALCSSLYTCQPISQLDVPISTCCVYVPVDLGPAFEMDLEKLQCKAYTAVYSFEGDPEAWKYGVALKYKFNVKNDYPQYCGNCEKSNGACAYTGIYNSFVCNCPSGVNTTTDCYFQASWNHGSMSKACKKISSIPFPQRIVVTPWGERDG